MPRPRTDDLTMALRKLLVQQPIPIRPARPRKSTLLFKFDHQYEHIAIRKRTNKQIRINVDGVYYFVAYTKFGREYWFTEVPDYKFRLVLVNPDVVEEFTDGNYYYRLVSGKGYTSESLCQPSQEEF